MEYTLCLVWFRASETRTKLFYSQQYLFKHVPLKWWLDREPNGLIEFHFDCILRKINLHNNMLSIIFRNRSRECEACFLLT